MNLTTQPNYTRTLRLCSRSPICITVSTYVHFYVHFPVECGISSFVLHLLSKRMDWMPSGYTANSVKTLKAAQISRLASFLLYTPLESYGRGFTSFLSARLPSVLWYWWLGVRKSIWPVKIEWWDASDLYMVQLMPMPPHLLPH